MGKCGFFCKYYCLIWISSVMLGFVPYGASPFSSHTIGAFKYYYCIFSDMIYQRSMERTCDLDALERTYYDKAILDYQPRTVRIFTSENATNEAIAEAFANGDAFVVKNATQNILWQYGDFDYLVENAPNKSYDVREGNWFQYPSYLNLQETLAKVRDAAAHYYIAFQSNLVLDYPGMQDTVNEVIANLQSKFPSLIDYGLGDFKSYVYFAFVYSGRWWKSPMHQERASGFNMMIRGSKQWSLVPHMYQTWMKSHVNQNPQVRFSERFCINATSDLPVIRFVTEPGDFFYIPDFWFHQVVNIEDGPGMMLGFRPVPWSTKKMLWNTFLPFASKREDVVHNLIFWINNIRLLIPVLYYVGPLMPFKIAMDPNKIIDLNYATDSVIGEYRIRLRSEYSSLVDDACLFGSDDTTQWGYAEPIVRDEYGARIE